MTALASTSQAADSPPTPRLLAELRAGDTGRVAEVAVDDADAGRLKALGVCTGRTVRVVSAGSPMIVQVLNTRVGVSAQLAACVTLNVC